MTLWVIDVLSRRGVQMKTNFINKTKWDAAMAIAEEEMKKPPAERGTRTVELESAMSFIDFSEVFAVHFVTMAPDMVAKLNAREVTTQHAVNEATDAILRPLGLAPGGVAAPQRRQ